MLIIVNRQSWGFGGAKFECNYETDAWLIEVPLAINSNQPQTHRYCTLFKLYLVALLKTVANKKPCDCKSWIYFGLSRTLVVSHFEMSNLFICSLIEFTLLIAPGISWWFGSHASPWVASKLQGIWNPSNLNVLAMFLEVFQLDDTGAVTEGSGGASVTVRSSGTGWQVALTTAGVQIW